MGTIKMMTLATFFQVSEGIEGRERGGGRGALKFFRQLRGGS